MHRFCTRNLALASPWIALALAAQLVASPTAAYEQIVNFGSNPGNLLMYQQLPSGATAPMPLVLVLHGCTQTGPAYADATGWSALSNQLGSALVVAEQQTSNHSNRCFNWFETGDTGRGAGEALSLFQMVNYAQTHASIDPSRIFVTGLSAGGAMTTVMLATYPDLFAAGAVMSGLPYRCATDVNSAYNCMYNATSQSATAWGDLVRNAYSFAGPWPRIAIWHGSSDTTVVPANADELALQWTDVHGLAATPSSTTTTGRDTLERWNDNSSRTLVEQHLISNMGHGTPVAPTQGNGECGTAGAYILDVGICSTLEVARFFGLAGSAPVDAGPAHDSAIADSNAADRRDAGGTDQASAIDAGSSTVLAETFSDLDHSGDGLDLSGWTLSGFDVVASDRQGNASSGAGHGHAVSGYSCQAGTVSQTLSRTFALGPRPQLSYWRKLELRATPNINSSAAFRLRVAGSVVDEQQVTFDELVDSSWSLHQLDLSALANSSVTIVFEVAATGTVCIEIVADALLDDIQIVDQASDAGSSDRADAGASGDGAAGPDAAQPDSAGRDAIATDRSAADRLDAGTGGDDDDGCGCAAGAMNSSAGWLALMALALGRRRRR